MYKRGILYMAIVMCLVLLMSGCQGAKLSDEEYATQYDQIMLKLEESLHGQVFYNLPGFFSGDFFSENYDHMVQVEALEHLIRVLDDVMYDLDTLGKRTDNQKILKEQSAIEYALNDIRGYTDQLLNTEVMGSVSPNKNTLYREVYRYMTGMNQAVLTYVESQNSLDAYLQQSRSDNASYDYLSDLKIKNRMRYLYTYMMITTYVAPMEDYTGLHVDPRFPWIRVERTTTMAYELSFAILFDFRDFYLSFVDMIDMSAVARADEDLLYFYENIAINVEAYETYFQIRSQYPGDFFLSGAYKAYQEQQGRTWDFKEEYTDLIQMRNSYGIIRDLLSDEKMIGLMY